MVKAYEPYVGRWSRLVAREFLQWLGAPGGGRWLDVGCGTGALTSVICETAEPVLVIGCDSAPGYIAYAQAHLVEPGASLVVADAVRPPPWPGGYDAVVAGLVLNFLPNA